MKQYYRKLKQGLKGCVHDLAYRLFMTSVDVVMANIDAPEYALVRLGKATAAVYSLRGVDVRKVDYYLARMRSELERLDSIEQAKFKEAEEEIEEKEEQKVDEPQQVENAAEFFGFDGLKQWMV